MLLSEKETGVTLRYWRARNNYRQKNCKDKICKFCNTACSFPNFENWLESYRRNKKE